MQPISFTSHGYKLAGHLVPAAKPRQLAFLLIQGWTGHQNLDAARCLADLGFTCMTYDMRGNGDSQGNLADFSCADFIADAVTAYDFLQKQLAPGTKIGVIGSSFGSYTAALLSARRPVFCLSLRVPANYPDETFTEPALPLIAAEAIGDWRSQPLTYQQNSTLRAVHDFGGQIQIIEAEKDELIDPQTPQNYAAAVNDPSQLTYDLLKDAPHTLATPELRRQYEALLTRWAHQWIK